MRLLFAVLLLLNLALWGWIRFIDVPARPAPPVEKAAVPTLHLASDPGALAAAAARCVSIGPFSAVQLLEVWRIALAAGAYAARERSQGEPAQTWLDIDLAAGQPAFAAEQLPGSPSMEGLRQEQCATRAVPELPAGGMSGVAASPLTPAVEAVTAPTTVVTPAASPSPTPALTPPVASPPTTGSSLTPTPRRPVAGGV